MASDILVVEDERDVKHLVITHGGELTLTSEPRRGTTVRVTLLAAEAPA